MEFIVNTGHVFEKVNFQCLCAFIFISSVSQTSVWATQASDAKYYVNIQYYTLYKYDVVHFIKSSITPTRAHVKKSVNFSQ